MKAALASELKSRPIRGEALQTRRYVPISLARHLRGFSTKIDLLVGSGIH